MIQRITDNKNLKVISGGGKREYRRKSKRIIGGKKVNDLKVN